MCGAGTILAENYAVSIFGNIQPRVLRESISALAKDGLVQRFIPVPLRADQTRLGNPVPEYMTTSPSLEMKTAYSFTPAALSIVHVAIAIR